MSSPASDSSWPDTQRSLGQAELAFLCGMGLAELDELVARGALTPLAVEPEGGRRFSASCLAPLREAHRVRTEQGLDMAMTGLLLGYLQRIYFLEHRLRALQGRPPQPQQLPREGPTPWREPHA